MPCSSRICPLLSIYGTEQGFCGMHGSIISEVGSGLHDRSGLVSWNSTRMVDVSGGDVKQKSPLSWVSPGAKLLLPIWLSTLVKLPQLRWICSVVFQGELAVQLPLLRTVARQWIVPSALHEIVTSGTYRLQTLHAPGAGVRVAVAATGTRPNIRGAGYGHLLRESGMHRGMKSSCRSAAATRINSCNLKLRTRI